MKGKFGESKTLAADALKERLVQCVLVLEMTVSGNLLTWLGSSYISEQGTLPEKIHPGTYLAAIALGLTLMRNATPLRNMQHIISVAPFVALCFSAFCICIIYALLTTGAANLIVLIDTFLPAAMLAVAVIDYSQVARSRLRRLLCCLFFLNASLALFEAIIHFHLIPIAGNIPELPSEFRPTALYDHPLTAATATMVGMYLRPSAPQGSWLPRAYQVILVMALVAFGGRVALALTAFGWSGLWMRSIWLAGLRRHLPPYRVVYAGVIVVLTLAAVITLGKIGIGERVLLHAYWDPSAQSRVSEFTLLTKLDAHQIIFGCRRVELLSLIEPLRLSEGLDVIENFWLLMYCTLGGLGYPIFLVGLIALLGFLWRIGGLHGQIMILAFLVAVSSSNSLGRKSTLLVILVGCAVACTEPADHQRRLARVSRISGLVA